MGLSRLAEKCRHCPFADDCDRKEMEALGTLPLPTLEATSGSNVEQMASPVLRKTKTVVIEGELTIDYVDKINSKIFESLYSGLGLRLGG